MPNYRRAHVPGGTFFFTVVTYRRRPIFQDRTARTILGEKFRECQRDWPFEMNAVVLLPDHLHAIWTLPHGDTNYSARWSWIKKEFTREWLAAGGTELPVPPGKHRQQRRGVWQPRFWEHTVKDEDDFEIRFDYIHYNPVKHGYVRCPRDWPWSSFHRWVAAGVYPRDWACGSERPPDFQSINDTSGEPTQVRLPPDMMFGPAQMTDSSLRLKAGRPHTGRQGCFRAITEIVE